MESQKTNDQTQNLMPADEYNKWVRNSNLKFIAIFLPIFLVFIWGLSRLAVGDPNREISLSQYSEVEEITNDFPELKQLINGDYISYTEYTQIYNKHRQLEKSRIKSNLLKTETEQ